MDLGFLYNHKLAHGNPMANFILDKSMILCIMTKICSGGVPARGYPAVEVRPWQQILTKNMLVT